MAQLHVEPCRKLRAEVEAAVPDGCNLTQIELTLFIRKRKTLVAGCAVVSREKHIGRITIGIKANCMTTLTRDGLNHSRYAVVIVAVCDDENGHRKLSLVNLQSVSVNISNTELGFAQMEMPRACPVETSMMNIRS